MKPNGPAVEGVCVTSAAHPATCPGTLAGNLSWWASWYGAIFAIMVCAGIRSDRVTSSWLIDDEND